MSENATDVTVTVVPEPEKKPNFVKRFTQNHPRAAKVAAVTAAGLAVVGTALLVKSKTEDGSLESGDVVYDVSPSTADTSSEA